MSGNNNNNKKDMSGNNNNNKNDSNDRRYVGWFITGGRRMTGRFLDEDECMSFHRDLAALYHDNAQLNDDVLNHGLRSDGDEFRCRVEHWLGRERTQFDA